MFVFRRVRSSLCDSLCFALAHKYNFSVEAFLLPLSTSFSALLNPLSTAIDENTYVVDRRTGTIVMLQTGSGNHKRIPKKSQEPKGLFDRPEATPPTLPRLLLWPPGFQAFVDRPSPPQLLPSFAGREHVASPPAPDYLTKYLADPLAEPVPHSTKQNT